MRGGAPLGEAALALLAERLKKAAREVKPASKGDTDGVHDLRVAIRKIRAAISVLRETILDDALDEEDAKLARLFSALGDVRDHDVLVERMKRSAKRLRLDKKGTATLRDDLDHRGRRASKRLRALMRADDPRGLFEKVRRRAKRAIAEAGPHGDDHRVLVRHFAASVLARRFETVLAYEVVMPAPLDVLHRLRVAIKKLRYAVDFFCETLGGGARQLDRTLQTAQDQLGDLHDHQVARDAIADVERKHASRRKPRRKPRGKEASALEKLRHADDVEAKRLLAAFTRTWQIVAHGPFAKALGRALVSLVSAGPSARRPASRSSR
jgi:triphosphatase